jgi:hypothetical protein
MGNATPVQEGKDIIEIIGYANSKRWGNCASSLTHPKRHGKGSQKMEYYTAGRPGFRSPMGEG